MLPALDDIDPACGHLGEQPLEPGAQHIAARKPAIVESAIDQHPALMALAQRAGGAGRCGTAETTVSIQALRRIRRPSGSGQVQNV
jgi:hypothetical protein